MTDIVERLRAGIFRGDEGEAEDFMQEAAAEIERLRNANDQLSGYTKSMEEEVERLQAELDKLAEYCEQDLPVP